MAAIRNVRRRLRQRRKPQGQPRPATPPAMPEKHPLLRQAPLPRSQQPVPPFLPPQSPAQKPRNRRSGRRNPAARPGGPGAAGDAATRVAPDAAAAALCSPGFASKSSNSCGQCTSSAAKCHATERGIGVSVSSGGTIGRFRSASGVCDQRLCGRRSLSADDARIQCSAQRPAPGPATDDAEKSARRARAGTGRHADAPLQARQASDRDRRQCHLHDHSPDHARRRRRRVLGQAEIRCARSAARREDRQHSARRRA